MLTRQCDHHLTLFVPMPFTPLACAQVFDITESIGIVALPGDGMRYARGIAAYDQGITVDPVLVSGEPYVAFRITIDRSRHTPVDGFTILVQPLAHLLQTAHGLWLNLSIRSRPHAQQQRTAFRHHLTKTGHHIGSTLIDRTRHPSPVVGKGDATLPWGEQLVVRNTLLGGLIVLIGTTARAVYNEQARLFLPCVTDNTVQTDVLTRRSTPSPVEPENVQGTIARHELVHLTIDKRTVIVPTFGILGYGVVVVTVVGGTGRPPVVGAVPVGFAETGPRHQTLGTESIEDMTCHVATFVVPKGTMCYVVVGLSGIPKAETVVMLGGENGIAHPCLPSHASPLGRIETSRVELLVERPVPTLELVVGTRSIGRYPVLTGKWPRLTYTWHAVHSPMEQDTELLVLPPLELSQHLPLFGPHIGRTYSVPDGLSLNWTDNQ